MEEKKNYILKPKTGKFAIKGMDIRLILEKVREYTKCSKGWLCLLIITIIIHFLYNISLRKILAIDIIFFLIELFLGLKAIFRVKETQKIIK